MRMSDLNCFPVSVGSLILSPAHRVGWLQRKMLFHNHRLFSIQPVTGKVQDIFRRDRVIVDKSVVLTNYGSLLSSLYTKYVI